METNLNEVSKEVYEANKLKGFDVKNENLSQTLLLVVSEITEAQDALRKNKSGMLKAFIQDLQYAKVSISDFEKGNENYQWIINRFETTVKDTFEDEIADTFIRLMDLVGALDIDIDTHIELKRKFNSSRAFKHGKAF